MSHFPVNHLAQIWGAQGYSSAGHREEEANSQGQATQGTSQGMLVENIIRERPRRGQITRVNSPFLKLNTNLRGNKDYKKNKGKNPKYN